MDTVRSPRSLAAWLLRASLGLLIGCAAAAGGSRGHAWTSYCCEATLDGTKAGCREIPADGSAACRAEARRPIECREVRRCSDPDSGCHCCRASPNEACTVSVRFERQPRVIHVEPEPEPELRLPTRPVDVRVWSPY